MEYNANLSRNMVSPGWDPDEDPKEAWKGFLDPTGLAEKSMEVDDMPDIEGAKTAPDPDDEEMRRMRERDYQRRYGKAGRVGTMLTTESNLG